MSLTGPAGAGGSGATQKTASAYLPTAQPQADQAYQGILQNLFGYANDPSTTPAGKAYSTLYPYGQQLADQGLVNQGMQGAQNAYANYQQLYPAAQNLGQAIPQGAINQYNLASNNPYANQAQQGANTGAGYGTTAAGNANRLSSLFSGAAPDVYTQGSNTLAAIYNLIPQLLQTSGAGQSYLQGLAPQSSQSGLTAQQQIDAAANPLQGLSQQLINTGFDPQNALYNRTQQQVTDQARAAAAASGMSGTPYGVGTENQALSNFNIDWQNNQLARQTQAAQAAQGIQSAIGGLFGVGNQAALAGLGQAGSQFGAGTALGLMGLTDASNLYGQGMNALTGGASSATGLGQSGLGQGAGATNLAALAGGLPSSQYLGNLAQQTQLQNQIANLASSGLNIGTQGAQGLGQFAGQPYSALGQAINNILTPGLGNIAQLGTQQFQLPQQVLNDLQSYLGLGQSASQISGFLGNLGLNQTSNALGGLGSLIGGASNLFGGGSSGGGLLGSLGSSGLLGELAGGSTGAGDMGLLASLGGDFSGGGDLAAAAGGGGLFGGSGLLGLGFLGL